MTRIQNGGRGYGKWKSELFFVKVHITYTVFLKWLREIAVIVAKKRSALVNKQHFNVDSIRIYWSSPLFECRCEDFANCLL